MPRLYCFICKDCRERAVGGQPSTPSLCESCGGEYRRDYASEGVGFNGLAEMKKQREAGLDGLSGKKAQRDLFLPTADEMRSPTDPTGQKGIREWAERHGPRETNKSPLYPEMEKRVF